MSFIIKLVLVTGKFLIGFVVVLALILLVVWVVSQGIQLFASALGYEVGSFFDWMIGGIARRLGWKKKSRKHKNEKSENQS